MIGLIAYQLPAEIANTAQARSKLILFSTLVGLPGMILPMILPNILLGGDNPSKEVFIIVMIIVGIIGGSFVFLSSYLINEKSYTQIPKTTDVIPRKKYKVHSHDTIYRPTCTYSSSTLKYNVASRSRNT